MSDNSTLVSRLERIIQHFEDQINRLEANKNKVLTGGDASQDKLADSTTVEVGESNHV